jgi:hypothetical protein
MSACRRWHADELAGPRPHCHGRGQEAKDRIDALRAIERLEEEARRVIGSSMLRMLQLVLGDRQTFTERSLPGRRRGAPRQVAQVADRFRWSLNGRGQQAKDRIDALRAIERLEEEARRVIGSSMLRMLQLVLGDRLTFTERSLPGRRRGAPRQVAQVADRFRWSLNCPTGMP